MATVKLPELGEGLSEGEVVSWRVKEGDTVKADSTLVEIMTDKATVEVPSPKSGVVKKLYYKPGEMAKVGAALVDIEEEGSAKASAEPAKAAAPKTASAEKKEKTPEVIAQEDASQTSQRISMSPAARVLASPAVRKMARDMNIDLSLVPGSGDRGRILRNDLNQSTAMVPSSGSSTAVSKPGQWSGSQREERIPFIGIRRKIADRLSQSKFTAVHFTHFDEIDFTQIIKLREEMNAVSEKNGYGVKLTYLPFFIKGAISAMKKYPILNSTLDTDRNEVVIKHYYHFGISVQTDNGLMVAVVRDCDQKDIFQIGKEIKEVADRARTGKASVQDLTGSTITITNPGNIGGLYATPVINFPETVILGMYQIKKRPIVIEEDGEDKIVSRPMMYTNITCDHRIIDGAVAAGYLRQFCDYMEHPARMAFL